MAYALKALIRHPRFGATVVAVVAPGVAIAAALLSFASLAHWSAPIAGLDRVVYVDQMDDGIALGISREAVSLLGQRGEVFAGFAYSTEDRGRSPITGPTVLTGQIVSGGYFDVLHARPLLGRALEPNDDLRSAAPVVVISEHLWRRFFSSSDRALGKRLELSPASQGVRTEDFVPSYAIVGVMPDSLSYITGPFRQVDYWVPATARIADYLCDIDLSTQWVFTGVGRLAQGVTPMQAETVSWGVWSALLERDSPGLRGRRSIRVSATPHFAVPFDRSRIGIERLGLLAAALAAVLIVITFSNMSGLLMLRVVRRLPEDAIRISLGAGPWLAAKTVLIEALVLALVSAAMAWLCLQGLTAAFSAVFPLPMGIASAAVGSDQTIRLFAGCAMLGLCAGALPAYYSRPGSVMMSLGGRLSTAPRLRQQWALIIPQIALATTVMMVAATVGASAVSVELASPGYDVDKLAYARFDLPLPPKCRQYSSILAEAVRERSIAVGRILANVLDAVPEGGAVSSSMPFAPLVHWIVSKDGPMTDRFQIAESAVSPRYGDVIGLQLLRGRFFDGSEGAAGDRVAVVSAAVAKHMWVGDPIGRQLGFFHPSSTEPPNEWFTVVGVVSDVRTPSSDGAITPWVYTPISQRFGAQFVVLRSPAVDPSVTRTLRETIARVSRSLLVSEVATVQSNVSLKRYPLRLSAIVLGGCCVLTASLACAGLYGLIAYSSARRIREFCICTALGANRSRLVRMALQEGATCATIGVGGGVILGRIALTAAAHLVDVMPPLTFGALLVLATLLAAVLVLASLGPARLVASVDASQLLRQV